MAHDQPLAALRTNWAYAYELVPPQSRDKLHAVKALLEDATTDAAQGASTWRGRFVREQLVTHILVVSDHPEQDTDVNRRLQAELEKLGAAFILSAAMAVPGEPAPPAQDS